MASGDVVTYVHNAGSGSTITFTPAAGVNIVILNTGGLNFGQLLLNNWVSSTTGVNYWTVETHIGSGRPSKYMLCAGQTMNKTDPQIDINGFSFSGIQL